MKDPAFAQAAYVLPDCTLRILDIQAVPSFAVIDSWTKESEMLVGKIQDKINLLLLVNGLENITGWDDEQISLMKNNIKTTMRSFLAHKKVNIDDCLDKNGDLFLFDKLPDQCLKVIQKNLHMTDFYYLYEILYTTVDGRPNVKPSYHTKEAMHDLRQSLQEYYKDQLNETYEEVLYFQKRLKTVNRQLNKELAAAISDIEKMGKH